MVEESEQNAQNQQHTPTSGAGGTGKPNRRLRILLGLLSLVLLASGWDHFIARPGVERAYAKVEEANNAMNNSLERVAFTNADVQRLLGRAPSETFQQDGQTVEVYAWQAGMPLEINGSEDRSQGIGRKTHDYYAVYETRGPDLLFRTHFKFKMDSLGLEMPISVATGENDSEAEIDATMTMPEGDDSGGGLVGESELDVDAQPDSSSKANGHSD